MSEENKQAGVGTEERPDWSNDASKVVWNMLKRQRDQARIVDVETDLVMQAIEAAPELERAMQKAFALTPPGQQLNTAARPGFTTQPPR